MRDQEAELEKFQMYFCHILKLMFAYNSCVVKLVHAARWYALNKVFHPRTNFSELRKMMSNFVNFSFF